MTQLASQLNQLKCNLLNLQLLWDLFLQVFEVVQNLNSFSYTTFIRFYYFLSVCLLHVAQLHTLSFFLVMLSSVVAFQIKLKKCKWSHALTFFGIKTFVPSSVRPTRLDLTNQVVQRGTVNPTLLNFIWFNFGFFEKSSFICNNKNSYFFSLNKKFQ